MARRGNAEGTITQRADGRWEARTYVLTAAGGRERRCVYGRTRAEASEKLTKLLSDAQRGIVTPKAGISVEAYLTMWLEEVAKRRV
jgi:hypothetical protein